MRARVAKKKDALRQKRKEKLILDELPKLRAQVFALQKGGKDLQKVLDAILIQAAMKYGAAEVDEETGEMLGWRIEIPDVAVEDTLAKYSLKAEKRDGMYVLGVFSKSQEDSEKNIQK